MKIVSVFLVTLIFALSAFSQTKEVASIEDLSWISGCWKKDGKTNDSFTMEHWSKPAGMLIGFSRSVKAGKVRFFEYLRIVENKDGIFYVAKPANAKSETRFKLTSLKDNRAVFENPKHDFPQRIVYHLTEKDTVAVRVEAEKDGKTQGFGYPMKKISCD